MENKVCAIHWKLSMYYWFTDFNKFISEVTDRYKAFSVKITTAIPGPYRVLHWTNQPLLFSLNLCTRLR